MLSSPLSGTAFPVNGMIFAAGLGTRFRPWTEHHPKALAPVNGKSLLQRNIEYLQHYGIREVVVNVHHFASQVIETVEMNNGWGSTIFFSDETGLLLETGGGLKKAAPLFKEPTIVLINVDILTDLPLDRMMLFHQQQKPLATLAVSNRSTSRYFLFNEENMLCGWRNIKTGEERISRHADVLQTKAFSGLHIIDSRLPGLIKQEGRLPIVELYLDLSATENIIAFDHTGSRLIDVGKPDAIEKAEALFP